MAVIEQSIVIDAPVEKVFAVHDDAHRVAEYMPGILRVADVVRTRGRRGDTTRLTFGLLGLRFPAKVTVEEWEENKHLVAKLEGALNGTFAVTYEVQGTATKVTWRLDYTLKRVILEKARNHPLAQRLTELNIAHGLQNWKLICESE